MIYNYEGMPDPSGNGAVQEATACHRVACSRLKYLRFQGIKVFKIQSIKDFKVLKYLRFKVLKIQSIKDSKY